MGAFNAQPIPQEIEFQGNTAGDYVALLKPRVMSLVVFTSIVGMFLAPGSIHPVIGLAAILCITVGSGAAGAINMWYDRDIDALMKRTQKRPIVTGKVLPDEALAVGITLSVFSTLLMALCVNFLSAFLLVFTILFYIFVYTIWLKRNHVLNVVVGGVAGALPPVIGWTSVTDNITIEPLILFLIIFMWTPPHSWALAIFRSEDYKACNIPMMPVVKGYKYTCLQIIAYSLMMVAATLLPYFFEMAGRYYLILTSGLGAIFLYHTYLLYYDKSGKAAKNLFWFSILYLFIIFLLLLVEGVTKSFA